MNMNHTLTYLLTKSMYEFSALYTPRVPRKLQVLGGKVIKKMKGRNK